MMYAGWHDDPNIQELGTVWGLCQRRSRFHLSPSRECVPRDGGGSMATLCWYETVCIPLWPWVFMTRSSRCHKWHSKLSRLGLHMDPYNLLKSNWAVKDICEEFRDCCI